MARVPIEVAAISDRSAEAIMSAIALANAEQDEFAFCMSDDEFLLRTRIHAYDRANVNLLMDQIDRARQELRGYRPFIIVALDSDLHGERYMNLFGSHRAATGIAIVTTAGVPDLIIPADRMAAYFIYYFARYALSFLSPQHRNHEDARDCVFDRKVTKADLTRSMRARALCDDCRHDLVKGDGMTSPRQFSALDRLFTLSGRILRDGFDRDGRARIFVGSSSEGLTIANKVQELLSDEFSVVIWNQGTVFGLGESTLEALEAAVLEYQSGVFVFTPDDRLTTRDQTRPVARDNVLFELGMFVGRLGRRKAFVLHPGRHGIALPTDLNGIATASYDPDEINLAAALGPPTNRIRSAIRQWFSSPDPVRWPMR